MLQQLQEIPPEQFERFIGRLVEKMGYEAVVTQYSQDKGVDVIASHSDGLATRRVLIQVKRYSGTVGVSTVRDLYGTLTSDLRATSGVLITTGSFSTQTKAFAHDKRIDLIDGTRLVQLIVGYDVLKDEVFSIKDRDNINAILQEAKIWEIKQKRRILYRDQWDDLAQKSKWLQMVRKSSKKAEAYYRLGNAYFEERELNAAAKCYSLALDINPVLVDALRRRGDCYYTLAPAVGEEATRFYKRALSDYLAALHLTVDIYTLNAVGLICELMNNKTEALMHYTQAIEQNPNYSESYFNRGRIFKGLGKKSEAIADFEKYLSLDSWHEEEVKLAQEALVELIGSECSVEDVALAKASLVEVTTTEEQSVQAGLLDISLEDPLRPVKRVVNFVLWVFSSFMIGLMMILVINNELVGTVVAVVVVSVIAIIGVGSRKAAAPYVCWFLLPWGIFMISWPGMGIKGAVTKLVGTAMVIGGIIGLVATLLKKYSFSKSAEEVQNEASRIIH